MKIMTGNEEREILSKAAAFEEDANYDLAVNAYSQLCQSNPTSPRYFALRGYANYCQEKYADALKDFNSALNLKPNAATTLFYRAQTHEKLDNLSCALKDYEASAEISPEADVFINIALLHRFQKNFTESIRALNKAIIYESDNEIAKNLLKKWKHDNFYE